ncbi:efflux RND transporter permease subunit [Dokdonella sp.]|uniref:efflux RND transporter permease subunit n=2 Tax=Dokdonella sp. TaxID=2291710 RepID=UPI002C9EE78C|nr:efflux RND transporter permease subunit [Dokdonella sp.]HOX71578.1 efflux RND transporter permease subunit [Dokdonella sp.]HPN79841.1 efflux RND transporter permease subunit [Dokdonella sp.]
MTLAELSLKRPVTAVMFFISMTVIGLLAAFRLPLEYMPDIEAPFLFIDIPYPGSTPAEIERTIVRPVEEALSTLTGIQTMNSQSRADGGQVFLEFKWGQNVATKAVEARDKIDAIRADLPTDLQRYFVLKFSTSDQPVMQLRISSDGDLSNSYELLDRKLKRPLERLPGVAKVSIEGVAPPEVQIELSSDRLSAHNVNLNDLAKLLRDANFSTSAGQIHDGGMRYRVQPMGEWRSLDEIRDLVLNDAGLRLGDIADVQLRPAILDYERRLDQRPAVAVDISRERSANLVEVGRAVLAEVGKVSREPEMKGLKLYFLQNQAKGVTDSLRELGKAGIEGTILSVLVLFFFLRDWRATAMVSLAIPICFVMTLGCMYFFGISLNILSMMGLLLAVGMLVDNAVVAVESIYQYRERYPDRPWYSAVEGTRAVGTAITAGTLTSIIVFLPNVFGERTPIAIYLTQVAISMAIAHIASWLVAVSLIPMLAAKLPPPRFIGKENAVTRLQRRYGRFVEWTLQHRRKTMFGLLALLLVSVIPMTQTKTDMFPAGDTRELQLRYDLNGNYRLPQLEQSIGTIEHYLDAHRSEFEIRNIYSYFNERGDAQTNILLTDDSDAKRTASEIMDDIRKNLPKLAIGTVGFDRNGGSDNGIKLSLIGDSNETLHEQSDAVIALLSRIPGLHDVRLAEGAQDREVAVRIDRERARNYGFSANDVAQYVSIALRGAQLRDFRRGDTQIPTWLRFQNADAQSISNMSDYKLRAPDGSQVPLMAMVEVQTQGAASGISRQNRQTALQIQTNVDSETTPDEARERIEKAMEKVSLPAGYGWTFGTSFRNADETGERMMFNILIALLLVYVVMCAMFESLIYPAAIMTTFVFSIFGVFWLFWITSTTFSFMAMIGILILMGVVVNNGIVMLMHINQLRHEGQLRTAALVQGSKDRLRPVLMTMGTAILAMVPLCIGTVQVGGDGPPYFPMARAIVGGLMFSTIVTLLALPVIYSLLDDARGWIRNVSKDGRAGRLLRHRPAVT